MHKLHTLNAVRVIMEFLIVSHHITDLGSENLVPHSYGITTPLMSFFFVLSGFVAMHSTDGLDKTYLVRRLKKTYPFFLLMWVAGFPKAVVDLMPTTNVWPKHGFICFCSLCVSQFSWGGALVVRI